MDNKLTEGQIRYRKYKKSYDAYREKRRNELSNRKIEYDEESVKVCSKCGEEKPARHFNKHNITTDGLRPECRDCTREMTLKSFYKKQFNGKREDVIKRDGGVCVQCGMTRDEHRESYGRDITVDHIDGSGCNTEVKNNQLSNLQTLCLKCHGYKDRMRSMQYET